MKSGNFRELLIDHSCTVHYIVCIWKLLYEVCLVQIKEQMGDNPLDIPFQMSRNLSAYSEQIEDEVWFCLLFYPGHLWKTEKNVKCFYALIFISSTFLFMVEW
jgi:hypothetical protein